MLFRWMILVCSGFAISTVSLDAAATTADSQQELIVVEQKIKELKKQLHQVDILEMKEEVEGQGLSIADWEAFSKDLSKIRRQNEREREILDELEKLQLRRIELLRSKSGNQAP